MGQPSVDLGDMLKGVQVLSDADLEGGMVTQAIVLASVMDTEGRTAWHLLTSDGVSDVEAIGALTVTLHHRQVKFESEWICDDD